MSVTSFPAECDCGVLLTDGRVARLRPILPGDSRALDDFHERLSGETVYMRYFAAHPHLRADEVEHATRIDYRDRLVLIVEVAGAMAAVASYDRLARGDVAEVAFLVGDAFQGRGLGTLLLEHLAAAARHRGVATFVAHTLPSNQAMLGVFSHSGFACEKRWIDNLIRVTMPTAPGERYLRAVAERDGISVRAWLAPRLGAAAAAGVAVLAPSGSGAADVAGALREWRVDTSRVVHMDEVAIDAATGLSWLTLDDSAEVVVVIPERSGGWRRFVAAARAATRVKPVLAPGAAGLIAEACRQAGVETGDAAEGARRLLGARRDGSWTPPERGRLPDLGGCDGYTARSALDRCRGAVGDPLPPDVSAEVLAAYGLPPGAPPAGAVPGAGVVVVGEVPGPAGRVLGARVEASTSPHAGVHTRLLPLTDRDAGDVADAAAPGEGGAADCVLRAARLVEDQPDVRTVRLRWAPPGRSGARAPWATLETGSPRGSDDDPFVRRLPQAARAGLRPLDEGIFGPVAEVVAG